MMFNSRVMSAKAEFNLLALASIRIAGFLRSRKKTLGLFLLSTINLLHIEVREMGIEYGNYREMFRCNGCSKVDGSNKGAGKVYFSLRHI